MLRKTGLIFIMFLTLTASRKPDTRPLRIVITGGPGSGKTTVINGLSFEGQSTLRETAADFITFRQAQNQPTPWNQKNFQEDLTWKQLQRENTVRSKVVWQDRSLIDSFAYWRHRGEIPGKEISAALERADLKKRYYNKVFLIKNLTAVKKTKFRNEDLKESLMIEHLIKEEYQRLGYEVVEVMPGSVMSRISYILSQVPATFRNQ